jgi:serine/threonine protein phosphatase PrpC
VTRDHSEARETADAGIVGTEVAANVITRAVGGTEQLYLDMELRELRDGDHYLLCSDGLTKELSDMQIATHLGRLEPRSACKVMIEQAAAGPCIDNVTVVAVQFREAQ